MDRRDDKIDFVIPWVDGGDPAWRREFLEYKALYTLPQSLAEDTVSGNPEDAGVVDASVERYRDWETLRYWFRGAEKFAPWVNRIHFVTWGHIPPWLDISHPKLHVVPHSDFIPAQYLPTFNSCPIELNIHRIEGLSEHFVYFNDDMFLCRPAGKERFFRHGLPRDTARLATIPGESAGHIMLECMRVINRRHSKSQTMRRNPGKWFNAAYSLSDMAKTLTLIPWRDFAGFKEFHMPQPFLKETFVKLWKEEPEELDAACRNRFRTPTNLSQWVVRYEQIASGSFVPVSMRDTKLTKLSDGGMEELTRTLHSGRFSMICINDNNEIRDPDAVRTSLTRAFDALLPEKSSYEL